MKINFLPYLLDIVLHSEVNSVQHRASAKDGQLTITLFKLTPAIWGRCEADGDKETLSAVKAVALKNRAELDEQLAVQRTEQRLADEKTSLRKQMALAEDERGRLEAVQQEEKEGAEREVYETFARMQAAEHQQQQVTKTVKPAVPLPAAALAVPSKADVHPADDLFGDDDIEEEAPAPLTPVPVEREEEEEQEEEIRYIPPPRSVDSTVQIKFTPRVFPTPLRESKVAEEQDWIAKNRQHLKHHGVLGKNVSGDVSEEDPVWLKSKGDDFFRGGDARSALNAYSAAIDADSRFTACYANRAACYLKLEMFAQCKLDCDVVVEHMQGAEGGSEDKSPERMKGLASLVKTLCRRGAALCQLGQFTESLSDYCQALAKFHQLDGSIMHALPNVSADSIKGDIDRLRLLCAADTLKKEADRLFSEQQLQDALTKYDQAIGMMPVHVSSLSNRSACKLALGDIAGAVEDCQTAIDLLQCDGVQGKKQLGGEGSGSGMLTAILPPPGSDKRKQWLLKTLARQAVGLVQLDRLDEAVTVYEQACKLEPKDAKLAADLASIVAKRSEQVAASAGTISGQ